MENLQGPKKDDEIKHPLAPGNNIIASSTEKAQQLAVSFSRAHTNKTTDDPANVTEVNNSIKYIDKTPLEDGHAWLVRPTEVAQLIRKL